MAKANVHVRRDDVVVRHPKAKQARLSKVQVVGEMGAADDGPRNDHFIVRNGVRCAGAHLIVDLYEADRLDDIDHIEATLRRCVEEAGATLLHIHLHHFEPNGGVSGVAVLAESHISIHSWPERNYAALDVFMCGNAEPDKCIPVLRQAFKPGRVAVSELLRGKSSTM
jgi:S-adenosylmethionine decarboxylase